MLLFVFFFIFTRNNFRIFHLSTDAPKHIKVRREYQLLSESRRILRMGEHKWYINELGFPGKLLPKSFDNLIIIIGDSYIQNMMNPDSCRQKVY